MRENCNRRFWGPARGLLGGAALFAAGICGVAEGVMVDREVLLLVDVTRSVSDAEFATMMESYADAFESSSVIAALESGDLGNIAASVVFYSDRNNQAVGVGWMEISDALDAGAFANQLRTAGRPFNRNQASIAEGLDFAVPLFGTETGGTANGFESTSQVISVTADGVDGHSRPTQGSRSATVEASRDAALASGVDVINALTIGAVGSVDDYFTQFVVGGSWNGAPGTVVNAETFADIDTAVAAQLQTVVPEPVGVVSILMGLGLLTWRRNRGGAGS